MCSLRMPLSGNSMAAVRIRRPLLPLLPSSPAGDPWSGIDGTTTETLEDCVVSLVDVDESMAEASFQILCPNCDMTVLLGHAAINA